MNLHRRVQERVGPRRRSWPEEVKRAIARGEVVSLDDFIGYYTGWVGHVRVGLGGEDITEQGTVQWGR